MKKTLALVLALAMVFSSITVAFAEDTLGADAQICANLGMLKGETGTVDAAYVATAPTRLQAAIMFLRLKGLEAEALAFTGEANFGDADQVVWAGGKAIMAYLKANPQLGWQGDGTNFSPNKAISAQEYYKVMLEALGYKQSTPEAVGQFDYSEVFTFAAEVGLSKVAEVTNFTVNDLAIATVEALKLNVKDGEATLAATLVEAGKIDKAAAIAAGLYTEAATTTDAKLDLALVIGNTKVLAQFDAAVEEAFAENVANFKVVEKGTTTEVEVKEAVLDGTKQVVLETAPLTAGKAYTLTVGDVSLNFAGVAKVTTVPAIDTVEGTDTERVVITFTTAMDLATALDPANYAIAGVTVKSVAWDDSKDRDAVELTTEGMTPNKTYTVKVTNVRSADLVVLKSGSKSFVSKSDKKAPTFNEVKADTNTRMILKFKDDNELTAESAENVENYQLTYGTNNANSLEVVSAKLVENDDDDLLWVELTTAPQKGSQKYTVHVNNITDTSVLGNKMTKEATKTVYGVKEDTVKPSFTGVRFLSDKIIVAEFTDKSRLDFASAQDINNYEINNDAVIEKAEMQEADNADCKSVKLTVSGIQERTTYRVTATNVADEYGNAIEETSRSKAYRSEDNTIATVKSVKAKSTKEFVITFNKKLDKASAQDVANYSINNDIGSPRKATYDSDDKTVTIKTAELKVNTSYTLTINGVIDEADREIVGLKAKFVVSADSNDTEKPTIEEVESVNKKVVRVTFSEPMNTDVSSTISIKVGTQTWTADYAVAYDEDDMVLEYTIDSNTFSSSQDGAYVTIIAVGTTDVAGNAVDPDSLNYEFVASGETPEDVTLDSYDQLNVRKFQLQFSEKIDLANAASGLTPSGSTYYIPDMKGRGNFEVTTDEDDDSIVYFRKASGKMSDDITYYFDISKLTNYHGVKVKNPDEYNNVAEKCLAMDASILDEDAPYIESVTAANRQRIELQFNEELSATGNYKLRYYDEKTAKDTFISVGTPSFDDDDAPSMVVLVPSKALESRYVYTLIQLASKAKDYSGNSIDASTDDELYDFIGSDVVATNDYITGVSIINGTTIKVYTNKGQRAPVYVGVYDSDGVRLATNYTSVNDDKNTYTIELTKHGIYPVSALSEDETYTVVIEDDRYGEKSYEFTGIVEDTISVTDAANTPTNLEYIISYSDPLDGDIVIFAQAGQEVGHATVGSDGIATVTTTVAKDPVVVDGSGTVTNEGTADVVSIIVKRGNVVIYYRAAYDLSDGE